MDEHEYQPWPEPRDRRRDRWERVESRVRRFAIYLCLFLIGYMLASSQTHLTSLGAVAHFGVLKGIQLGLREKMASLDGGLAETETLLNGSVDPARVKRRLADLRRELKGIVDEYVLTPEEQAVAAAVLARKLAEVERANDADEPTAAPGKPSKPAKREGSPPTGL